MAHYIYILQSLQDEGFYIGETKDVEKRLQFHNAGLQRSTKRRAPFKIIYTEAHENRASALKREKQIKSYKGGEGFKKLLNL
jgi:putative endonuclease